ncbi:enoyl-(Acyl carrier protein) reductase domain-containing protein [Ditylenchus destructor]|uniref:3-oxoacyl-[acyl-carrier-protein] reductase n=1 Tax=Ditylenchus destructor TaxID=166010 RepID=A0AAD4R0Q7_9BILA|nr:enoyl-(Acyl carrier protein) reductase domain-containing protein [Ditylenchus destructor]
MQFILSFRDIFRDVFQSFSYHHITTVQWFEDTVTDINIHFSPGYTKSEFRSRLGLEEDKIQDAVIEKIILGRFGEASEIANAILFVASSKASYITGATIVVDGGLLVHP